MNWEPPDVQAGFRKGRGTRDQIANIHWIIEKAREFQKKHLFLLYWLCQSLWLCGSQQSVENSWRDGNTIPLTCLLRNLYADQEATVRTGHGTMVWFQIGNGVHQGCIVSLCLLNLNAEYIMRNARLDEAQAGIKISGRNVNHLNTDDTTLWQKAKRNWRASGWKWKKRVKKLA